jgi:hypothetical protein
MNYCWSKRPHRIRQCFTAFSYGGYLEIMSRVTPTCGSVHRPGNVDSGERNSVTAKLLPVPGRNVPQCFGRTSVIFALIQIFFLIRKHWLKAVRRVYCSRPLEQWGCGFESHSANGCVSASRHVWVVSTCPLWFVDFLFKQDCEMSKIRGQKVSKNVESTENFRRVSSILMTHKYCWQRTILNHPFHLSPEICALLVLKIYTFKS